MKIAIQHNMAQRLVELAFLDLKGENTKVLEQDLEKSFFMKKYHKLPEETEQEYKYLTRQW